MPGPLTMPGTKSVMTDDPRIVAGMAAQGAMLATHMAGGESQAGWKLGFGSPSGLELLQLEAPLVGFLLHSRGRPSGTVVDVSLWTRPVVEAEIAVRLALDLPAGSGPDRVRASVACLLPALELADVDAPASDVVEVLAGDIYQRLFILGEESGDGWAGGPASLDGVVTHGDASWAVTDMQALTGEFVANLAHAAGIASRFGRGLVAGDVVLMGSVVPPVSVSPGDDFAFRVDGHPPVSVRIASQEQRD